VPLAVDKQRRLCLTNRHVGCPTFVAASDQPGRAVGHSAWPPPAAHDTHDSKTRARPGGDTVTRWSIVRTAPVLLDRGGIPSAVASLARLRASPQLLLVLVVALAFVAVAAPRLSGTGSAPMNAATPSGSPVAVVAAASSVPASALPEPSAPSASPVATPAPTLPLTTSSHGTYRVKRGDTLYEIAHRFKTTVSVLQRLNGLGNSTTLHAGDILKLP
jgi:LysM repeat protein